jgi:hypothetical protein
VNLATNAIAIAAGFEHSLALTRTGTVVRAGGAYGGNAYGQVPGLSNVIAIAAGDNHSVALRADGTVVCWGDNFYGQTNVPGGLSNIVSISGGYNYTLALRADGTVASWGYLVQAGIPASYSNILSVAAGYFYSLALLAPPNLNRPSLAIQPDTSSRLELRLDGYPGRFHLVQTTTKSHRSLILVHRLDRRSRQCRALVHMHQQRRRPQVFPCALNRNLPGAWCSYCFYSCGMSATVSAITPLLHRRRRASFFVTSQ